MKDGFQWAGALAGSPTEETVSLNQGGKSQESFT